MCKLVASDVIEGYLFGEVHFVGCRMPACFSIK